MTKYVTKRILFGLISLVVFTFVMFWLVEALIPGDFFSPMRLGMTAEEVEALRELYGVNDPIVVRWWRWFSTFFRNGLGSTTFGRGIGGTLGQTIPPTVFVFVTGLLLAYLIGQWLGRFTGWRRTLGSDALTLGGIGFSTLFPPFLGFVLVTELGLRLRHWRAAIFEDARRDLWFNGPFTENGVLATMTWTLVVGAIVSAVLAAVVWRLRRRRVPPSLTALVAGGITVVLWEVVGVTPWALDMLFEAALPLIAFTLLAFGEFMLIMQTGMVGLLNEDFVATARAKGLREHAIRDRHAARNASLAVVARLAVSIPYLFTGLVIIERAVGWSGIGSFLFNAIDSQDIPAVVSTLAVIGAITLVVRLVLDLLLLALDPRISRPAGGAA